MGKYKIHNQQALYYLTLTTVDWIDVFTRADYRDILLDSFRYCIQEKSLVLYAYYIMSNHIHLIAQSNNQQKELSAIIRDFKSFTAKQIQKTIQNTQIGESRREWMQYLFGYYAKGGIIAIEVFNLCFENRT